MIEQTWLDVIPIDYYFFYFYLKYKIMTIM
jgi:hypothetical protein